jgi:hypothetical protein
VERELFSWDEWDGVDECCYMFYNPVLKVKMGLFPVGTEFNTAVLDYQNGTLEFSSFNTDTRKTEAIAKFKLHLTFE